MGVEAEFSAIKKQKIRPYSPTLNSRLKFHARKRGAAP